MGTPLIPSAAPGRQGSIARSRVKLFFLKKKKHTAFM